MPPVLNLRNIVLTFGGEPLINDANLSLERQDKACLVGRNGAGKSTLLKIAAGLIEPDHGEYFVQPGITVGYLPQEPDLSSYSTIAQYVADGLPQDLIDAQYLVDAALDEVSLNADALPAQMSGGEIRRAAIAKLFVADPDVILLDEPTNHLDIATIEWLEQKLASFRGAMIAISHDRAFLNRLTTSCLWLDRGQVRSFSQGFKHFEEWAETVLEQEEAELHRLNKQIERETHWLHRGVTARRKRNMGRLRKLDALREKRQSWISAPDRAALELEAGEKSGAMVIEAKNISKSFTQNGAQHEIISNFSTRILRGDRIGLIGPNGAGKTTLLKILMGELTPDSGTIRLGTNLTTNILDQKRQALNEDKTLWDILCPEGGDQVMVRGRPRHVVGYLKDFLFDERQIRQPVSSLSGGERNRLLLAAALAKPSNLLVLDEPTNDLDMDSLDVLQEILADYEGTLLLVSHDRDFLDRIVTSTIAFEGEGRVREYPGGYTDYLKQRKSVSPQKAKNADKDTTSSPDNSKKNPDKPKGKLSYKDQRLLDRLSVDMPRLEKQIQTREAELSDPDLFAKNPEKFSEIADQLEKDKNTLETMEEQWLELELKRDSLLENT